MRVLHRTPPEIVLCFPARGNEINLHPFGFLSLDKSFGCSQKVGVEAATKTPVGSYQQKLNRFHFLFRGKQCVLVGILHTRGEPSDEFLELQRIGVELFHVLLGTA